MSDEAYDFDGLIDQQNKIKEDHLRSSMNIAVGKNRGEQAKLFELGEKAQLPVDVVERNTQQVQQQVDYEANKYDDLINNYPAISEYLGDPNRAALVYDDVSVLTDISDYVRSGSDLVSSFGAGSTSIGGSIKGIADLSTALGSKTVSLLPEGAENAVREFDKDFTKATDIVNPISIARRAGQSFNNLSEMMRPPVERRNFLTDVFEGLGQLAGQVGLTLLTGGAAGSVAFAGMGADQMEQEAVREGASQADKDNAIIYGSMITAASEKLGIDRLLNRLPPAVKNKILSRITDIMIGGGIEASQEAAENILFNFAEQITFDEDQELVEGVGHSSAVGGAVGSIARAITMGASKKLRDVERDRQQAEVAQQNVDQIKGLFEKVESAAVSETAPAEAEKLFQSIMDENGIETFTFEPTEFASAIEENGADLQEITDRLGITDQFNVALANGDQIDIPAGKVMAEFANNDLQDAILGSYRSSEETMTLNDSQAMMEMLEQETKQAYEDAGLEADEVLQMETKADEVYDAVASEMLKGDVESEVGQRHPVAELYRAFALRQMADWKAEGKDFDPFDFYEKLGLTFSNEKGEPVPAKQKVRDLGVSAQLNDLRKRGPKNEMLPLFNFIKDNGRVKTGSKLAAELQAIGITPKSHVGLFSNAGEFGDADNIVASEFDAQFGVTSEQDDNGYVDRNWLLEKISDGSFGQRELSDLDILEDQINKAGIDINSDNDSIIRELFADEPQEIFQGETKTLFQRAVDGVKALVGTEDKTDTEAFKEWAGTDKPVIEATEINNQSFNGEGPFILQAFHGTTHEFEAFDATRGNTEGHFGAVNYFTSSEYDAVQNYEGEGPDLTGRITERQEEIAGENDWEYDDPRALEQAKSELYGGNDQTLEVFVKTEKPFVVGSDEQWLQMFDSEGTYEQAVSEIADENAVSEDVAREEFEDDIFDRNQDLQEESGSPLIDAIETVADRFDDINAGELISAMYDFGGEFTSDQLASVLRTNEAAVYATDPETGKMSVGSFISDVIQEMGYDSIILKNADQQFESMDIESDTAHIHVFHEDRTNIKSVDNVGTFNANDDRILHQKERGFIKGNFGDINSKFEIVTLKDANMSTLLHETGHLFLEMMNREVQMDGAPQRVQDNMAATLEYLGVDSFDQIETEHHEKFARSFEVYLRTGKAPTLRLRRAFDKFKAWLVQVYETLRGNYDIEMSADVQNVFNTLLATEEEILEAEEQTGFEMSAELTELMNEEEQAEYRRNAEDTHSEAYNKALALKIREEQRDQTKAWRENRKRVEGEVTQELYKEPIYQVWNLIKKGEFFEQETPDHLKGQRLNKQSLIDVFGSEGVLKELPHGMYSVDGGIDVEYLADRMGYETSNALLEDLVNAEKPADAIQARTDQRMEIEYPKVGVAEIALKAVQNNRQSIFLETELKILRKKNKNDDTRYNIDVIREAVNRAIETMPIKQVMGKARTYLANSRRAGKVAERALIAKDYELAMEEKRKQLLNYEMFRAISDAKGKTDKMKSRLFKLANKKINPKTMKPEYIERIKDLLYSYSFAEVNKPREARRAIEALEKFVLEQNQNATDEGRVQIQVSPRLMEASEITDWRDLTFEQLGNLDDAAKTLAHIGRKESKEEQEAHASLVSEIGLSIEDNVRVRKKWGTIADQNTVKAGFWNSIAPAYLRRLPSYINELDGFGFDGPMAKAILQPLEDATVKFEEILDPIRKRVSENQKKSYNFKELMALKKKNIFIDQLQEKITKENLLALAHNWGNQGNRDAIMNGVFKGLSEADVENIFKDHMTKKDWDYVQENLDIVNSLWPEISELQRRQTGTTPPKVESTVIKTEFGEYAGGYYPLKYSPINSAVANQKAREAATNAPVIGMAATVTKHGHTEERVAGHGFPVEMSMDVMYNHLGSVIHDLAYREAIQSAAKVMRSKPVSEAIIKTKGPQAYEVLQLILSAQAVGDGGQIKGWEKASKHLRLNFAIAVIGLNMRSVLTQPTGMLQAFVSNKVGFGYMAKALAQFTAGGLNMRANIKEIHDKSPYMARRSKVFRNELREQSNKIGASGLKDNMVAASFYPMIKLDSMIAGIVWNGAYNKAQDQGLDEGQSIRFADRMVRDTQASGEQYQLSGLTNTGEFGKMLTIFGSYFSATYNLTAESFNQARNGADAKSWATFGMDMILLHGAQGILAALMLEHWPDDEDEWGMWTLQALASQVFGMVPVASSAYRSVMSGFGVNSLPADAVINTTLQAGQSIAKDIENGDLSDGTVKSMARSASYLAGIPAVNGIIRAYDVLEEDEDASLLDVLLRPKQK